MSKKAFVIQEITQVVNDMYNSILKHIFQGNYTPSNNEKISLVIKDNLRIVSLDKVKKSVLTQLEGFNVMNKTLKDIVDKKNKENQIDVGTIISDKKCSSDKDMTVEQIKLPSKQLGNSKLLLKTVLDVVRNGNKGTKDKKDEKGEEDKTDEVKEGEKGEKDKTDEVKEGEKGEKDKADEVKEGEKVKKIKPTK